jgi:hypothetical protein
MGMYLNITLLLDMLNVRGEQGDRYGITMGPGEAGPEIVGIGADGR